MRICGFEDVHFLHFENSLFSLVQLRKTKTDIVKDPVDGHPCLVFTDPPSKGVAAHGISTLRVIYNHNIIINRDVYNRLPSQAKEVEGRPEQMLPTIHRGSINHQRTTRQRIKIFYIFTLLSH